MVLVLSHFSRVRLFVSPLTVARLPCPWDSPGKNPGVGCPALLQNLNDGKYQIQTAHVAVFDSP